MTQRAALIVALLAAGGFLAGFMWGRGTRDALSGNTSTEFSGGVLTVRTNLGAAASEGLSSLFR